VKKTMRRAQTIQPVGVGAIFDINGEGFIVKDISCWPQPNKKLNMPRLQQLVGNKVLRSFSDADANTENLPALRFPSWYYCAQCHRLSKMPPNYNNQDQEKRPQCINPQCASENLSPMRFVAYCNRGHLAEINWFKWCHLQSDRKACSEYGQLEYHSSGRDGGDFHEMKVVCKACGAENTLAHISAPAPQSVVYAKSGQHCCGNQPWQGRNDKKDDCTERMKIEPRGSSSVYRAKILSALDIAREEDSVTSPDAIEGLDILLEEEIRPAFPYATDLAIAAIENPDGQFMVRIEQCVARVPMSFEDGVAYLKRKLQQPVIDTTEEPVLTVEDPQQQLLLAELAAFRAGEDLKTPHLHVHFIGDDLQQYEQMSLLFSNIAQVRRLRELRVLTGFSRGKGERVVPVDLKGSCDWLPTIEAIGEGLFFELNPATLQAYFKQHGKALQTLVEGQITALDRLKETSHIDMPNSPLFILTHTLSHLLMKELTFNSGYSSSALRERLFVDPDDGYAGILIYTTDLDAEGTLGGLVDQGRLQPLSLLIAQCLEAAQWCSADPVCRETEKQGFSGLNRAACHCCSLVSETSCVHQNALLNRLTLGGMGEARDENVGFFNYLAQLA
jgi:hypothetical protein